jgi:hypothetical protein
MPEYERLRIIEAYQLFNIEPAWHSNQIQATYRVQTLQH